MADAIAEPNLRPYEILPIAGKGLGVMATAHIARGTCIMAEEPLLRLLPGETVASSYKAFLALSDADQMQYLALHDNASPVKKQEYLAIALAQTATGEQLATDAEAYSDSGDEDGDKSGGTGKWGRVSEGTAGADADGNDGLVLAASAAPDASPTAHRDAYRFDFQASPWGEAVENERHDEDAEQNKDDQEKRQDEANAVEDAHDDSGEAAWSVSGEARIASIAANVKVQSVFETNAITLAITPNLERGHSAGTAVFSGISRINHSCTPNVAHTWNQVLGVETVYAVRDIAPGEELTIAYVPVVCNGRQQRQAMLSEFYGFECDCIACSIITPEMLQEQEDGRMLWDRRLWLQMADQSVAEYEDDPTSMIRAGVIQSNEHVLQILERMMQFVKMEGLRHPEVIHIWQRAQGFAMHCAQTSRAAELAEEMLDVLETCSGKTHEDCEDLAKRIHVAKAKWNQAALSGHGTSDAAPGPAGGDGSVSRLGGQPACGQ